MTPEAKEWFDALKSYRARFKGDPPWTLAFQAPVMIEGERLMREATLLMREAVRTGIKIGEEAKP